MGMNLEKVREFLKTEFPQNTATVKSVGNSEAVIEQRIEFQHLRPGNTVSGPTMMTIADCAIYVAIQGDIGPQPLAVTTNLVINFLRKPNAQKTMVGKAKLIKSGRRLIIGNVEIFSEGIDEPVAFATATYSVPPK